MSYIIWSVKDVCKIYGICRQTASKLMRQSGALVNVPRRLMVRADTFVAYMSMPSTAKTEPDGNHD